MKKTYELEEYIKNEITRKLGKLDWMHIKFCEWEKKTAEGTYVFAKLGKYHIQFIEKGKLREEVITENREEVLWRIIKIFSFDIALESVKKEDLCKKEFRKVFFEKQLEVYSLFGKEFVERRRREIEEIFVENP